MVQEILKMAAVCLRFQTRLMLLAAIITSTGCVSVESTMVTRDETNQYWERHNCLNGIPITLRVPTHLKLYVFHTHYIQPVDVDPATKRAETYTELDMGVVVRDFAQEFMFTEKVFFVDFKRPVAGSSNLRVKMTDQQYIDAIQHDITDTTIADIRGALAGVQGTPLQAPTVADETKPTDVIPIRSLVAVGIFDVAEPDFEHRVRAFMDCHINQAHDAWVVPPGVESINRIKLGPHENRQLPYPPTPLCPSCDQPFFVPHSAEPIAPPIENLPRGSR